MLKQYPPTLPAALKADRAFQMVDPLVSSTSDNGQTRWDRRFTDVPNSTPVSWIFTDWQCALFRSWFANTIRSGADWFEMPLTADDGREMRECHFVQAYAGPERLGYDRWRITATLVLRRLPTIDPGWIEIPEFWDPRGRKVFDNAINMLWPLNKFQVYILDVDEAINKEWPTP